MTSFASGYRNDTWMARGIMPTTGENAKTIQERLNQVSFDPTKMYPSVESPLSYDKHLSSGVFFRFNTSPTSFDLDPYFFFAKNDYAITVRSGKSSDLNHKKESANATHSVQAMVHKGPLYLSGWGYDIAGLPVPSSGILQDTRIFDPNTPIERRLWKTGPVDLRWDDDRKVWVGGPEIIEGKMLTSLPAGDFETPTSGSGVIYRIKKDSLGTKVIFSTYNIEKNESGLFKPDPFGVPVNNVVSGMPEIVTLYNRNNKVSLASGEYFSAMKINYEWRVMGGGGGGNCIVGKFKKLNCSSPTITKTSVPSFTLRKKSISGTNAYEIKFDGIGTKRVFYFQTDQLYLKDLIPSDAAGGKVVSSLGTVDITNTINGNKLPYSGYFAVCAFNNCEMSSDVYTFKFPNSGDYIDLSTTQPDGTTANGVANLVSYKPLNKLFECPQSDDNFGIVTDDQTGGEYFAMHPFKFIKHNVRVVACGSNLDVICNNTKKTALVITEVDDCANTGTSVSRE
jgi:hypothetical protein